MNFIRPLLFCFTLAFPTLGAAQSNTSPPQLLSYQKALDQAAADQSVAIVLLHGSDWNPLGEKLLAEVLPKFQSQKNVVLADVDLLQNPTDREFKSNQNRNQGWPDGKWSVPAVFAFGPDGKRYGVRSRLELYAADATPESVIAALVEASLKRLELQQQMAAANKDGDAETELKLLSEIMALPLERPDIDVDRIQQLDPNDQWGIVTQYKFPNLYSIIQMARNDATDGKATEAVTRFTKMLESKSLGADQRALVFLALGTVHHHTDGQADAAKKAFQDAIDAAAESVAGKIATQRLEQFYSQEQ